MNSSVRYHRNNKLYRSNKFIVLPFLGYIWVYFKLRKILQFWEEKFSTPLRSQNVTYGRYSIFHNSLLWDSSRFLVEKKEKERNIRKIDSLLARALFVIIRDNCYIVAHVSVGCRARSKLLSRLNSNRARVQRRVAIASRSRLKRGRRESKSRFLRTESYLQVPRNWGTFPLTPTVDWAIFSRDIEHECGLHSTRKYRSR